MISIESCAKVNLTLELLGREPDGYHRLATVFQAIDLTDRLTLSPAESLELVVAQGMVPADERNLCWRAAALLAREAGLVPRARLRLEKRIPVGAGLGGGSGNAAAALVGLSRLWRLGLTVEQLHPLAAQLGSDVAFFLRGGAAVGSGRGEQLEPLPALQGWRLVVLAPARPVSTAAVYRAVQGFRPDAGAATAALAAAMREGAVADLAGHLVNDLEAPAGLVSGALAADREALEALAPAGYRLSGSGGAWFLPARAEAAEDLAIRLRAEWPGRAVWVTQPVDYGWCLTEYSDAGS